MTRSGETPNDSTMRSSLIPTLFLSLFVIRDSASASPPNILFIFSDDHAQHAISRPPLAVRRRAIARLGRLGRDSSRVQSSADSALLDGACVPRGFAAA